MVDIRDFAGQRVHMIGIGGSSMSGLAKMLQDEGYVVTGSDRDRSHKTDELNAHGISVWVGHHPEELQGASLVVYSAAISPDDPERLEATRLNIPQIERAVLLGQLMRGYDITACVCGTHGKTTVSAMLSQVLVEAGLDPTIHIGGTLKALGGGAIVGSKALFVAEACEYNRSFLHMPPTHVILTNIEEDHLDVYGDMAHVEEAFASFLSMVPDDGLVLVNAEDERALRVARASGKPLVTFGLNGNFDYSARNLSWAEGGALSFDLWDQDERVGSLTMPTGGDFTARHALSVYVLATLLGVDGEQVLSTLGHFEGAGRRFEYTGTVKGMLLYHDYGHNPAEMKAALSVAKRTGRRVIAVMQPHTFSRVKTLFEDYLTCTAEADLTLVTDIYGAREVDPGDINTPMLIAGMAENGVPAIHTPTFDDTERFLLQHGQPGDLVLSMGCGNINLLNEQMQNNFDQQNLEDIL